MSVQSGITADQRLLDLFSECRRPGFKAYRSIKVKIDNEKLILAGTSSTQGSFKSDWDTCVKPHLENSQCCYILYRADNINQNESFEWILLAYVPDTSVVREKMLYSSTRNTLKKELGLVQEEIFGSSEDDLLWSGYQAHLASVNAPAPLTIAEIEVAEIKSQEVGASIGASTKHSLVGGGSIAFPISLEAMEALNKLKDGEWSFVSLSIDVYKETINLDTADNTVTENIASKLPENSPRYVFTAFTHDKEGESRRPIFFVYCCPGYKVTVKERMLYSSCRNYVIGKTTSEVGLQLSKKLEVSGPEELLKSLFYNELYPQELDKKKTFSKPKPGGRGPRRLVR